MFSLNQGWPVFRWIEQLEDDYEIDEDEAVDEEEEWNRDDKGRLRLLITGFKHEIGHPNATNDELRSLQDEALREFNV